MAYEPGRSRVGEPTPQTDPDQFSADDIKAEIRYLRRLNRKYGEHTLRTLAIVRLTTTLATRQSVTPAIAGQPVQPSSRLE
jgi:hypothetical protein